MAVTNQYGLAHTTIWGKQLSLSEMGKINVEYYVIKTMETFEDGEKTFFNLIPVTWVSGGNGGVNSATLECNFLFPDDASTRGSAIGEPSSWQHKSFKRFLHPTTEWMEYTGILIANKAGKLKCNYYVV